MDRHFSDELSLRRLLKDGLVYNAALGVFITGSLYYKPEIWVNDYPPDVKQKFGPQSPEAKRLGLIAAIPFLIIVLGGVVWSTQRLKRENGGHLSYPAAFTHVTLLILSVWLMDLTILDWLLFVIVIPDFFILPGTEGLAGYDDFSYHLKEHLRAFPFLVLTGAILAVFLASRKSPA